MGKVQQRLGSIPLFDSLAADQLKKLTGAAAHRTIRAREVLYEQGNPAPTCFAVLDGNLRFSVVLGKQKATSGLASANDLFGLEALQSRATRQETASAPGGAARAARRGSGQ